MNAETLARLTREAEAPEGIAVRVSGSEMKRLLEERAAALEAARLSLRVLPGLKVENWPPGFEKKAAAMIQCRAALLLAEDP